MALGAFVRLGALAFVVAQAIFVAFARLEDLYRQGFDRRQGYPASAVIGRVGGTPSL